MDNIAPKTKLTEETKTQLYKTFQKQIPLKSWIVALKVCDETTSKTDEKEMEQKNGYQGKISLSALQ